MRSLLAILFLLSMVCLGADEFIFSRSTAFKPQASSGSEPTYLIRQGFEGTGFDNSESWTNTGAGTIDPDNTTLPIDGSQSLVLTCVANQASVNAGFTAKTNVYGFFKFIRAASSGTCDIMSFNQSTTSNRRSTVRVEGSGALTIVNGSVTATTSGTTDTTSTYFIWTRYQSGAGSDSISEVAFSTTGVMPTSGANWTNITTGTSTTAAGIILLGTSAANETMTLKYDTVRVAASQIPDNPAP